MKKIDGKAIAEKVLARLEGKETRKFLAAFIVGDNPAAKKFQEQKKKTADALGVDYRIYRFPETISRDDLRKKIKNIAEGNACGAAILQLPLPSPADAQYALNAIPKEKDADVLGERALGAFYAGRGAVLPPAVGTFIEVFQDAGVEIENTVIAIVGLGRLVGRPVAHYAMGKAKEVFLLDKGSDMELIKKADVVVLGAGAPGLVTGSMLRERALVIDFGYGSKNGGIMGDFTPSADYRQVSYTPTPGGTGPILVAKLFENFFMLAGAQGEPRLKPRFYRKTA
jgi:methylenetetrahydrofolate dehydrogenase (NADP+)/methenyltetrahydrofolate cyclohydrolase